ncbi:MAG: sn-glycerol-3-phosphate ABC transporter ATP-binding protein UgpC [Albidovulum sp.]|nr:sn-glycerol-3-phosphate ABC transporter ATP-binding protein UgpC [Albidovulum sp.]
MSKVELRRIHKSFGDVEVLHDISLCIAEGEFVALVGPSGCGKSTLLRTVAGLEAVSGGEVVIGDRVVNELGPKERNVAMVFQNYALYPHMTIRENIGLNLRISRVPRADAARRTEEAAGLLGLSEYLDHYPSQLSGGQKQRVAMGRAIVRDPTVFLFDEPLSNLDAKLRVQMRGEIKSFHRTVGTTSIYVTHDQIEAMTLADRAVVLNAGRIEQVGPPIELYKKPDNVFVAGFIGSPMMNFFPGRVENTRDGLRIRLDNSDLELATAHGLEAGQAVTIGIRPEGFVVGTEEPALEGVVDHIEPTGPQTQLTVSALGRSATVVTSEMPSVATGDTIRLGVPPGAVHMFDTLNGRRISD